jgi:hypothetical protein
MVVGGDEVVVGCWCYGDEVLRCRCGLLDMALQVSSVDC